MGRTPLFQSLKRLAADHNAADASGLPVDAIREERAKADEVKRATGRALGRREFLTGGLAAAGATLLPWGMLRARPSSTTPRIAIIGGGLAGLSAALTLADAGISATIYEAAPRIGGRTRSDRPTAPGCGTCHDHQATTQGTWADGQITDIFGELVDSGHATMLSLAQRYGLTFVDQLAFEPAGATETYYFLGQHYPKAQADADFAKIKAAMAADLKAAGYPTAYNKSKPGGLALDNMSIYQWIETRVPGGHESPLGRLIDAAYNIEFGAETTDQSSLSMLYLLGYQPPGKSGFNVFGTSDERYRLEGGIQRLPETMAADVAGRGVDFKMGWNLEAITKNAGGTYTLDFDAGGHTSVVADYVLMAIPFAVLRDLAYDDAGFDELKDTAIQELGRGHNSKLHLQFTSRFWNEPGPWGISGGSSYSDTGYQVTWDPTRGQPGSHGILANYTGGAVTDALAQKHAFASSTVSTWGNGMLADANDFLRRLGPVFPRPDLPNGVASLWNGRATGSVPHLNPLFKNSYSYWRVGQYQQFAGYERVRQGNVFFAGEHTSLDFQGWMEGAAAEGVRAGKEMLASLK